MQGNVPRKSQTWRNYRAVQRHPRILWSVPLTLQYVGSGGVRTSHGISLDISESGIGALLQRTLQVGDTVGIAFDLQGSSLRTAAIVRYSSSVRSGFEFLGLAMEERARLAGIVART